MADATDGQERNEMSLEYPESKKQMTEKITGDMANGPMSQHEGALVANAGTI